MENRFLFIIDTSSAMKSRQEGSDTAVRDLLKSSMKGEMRNGDTFGVWTYSDKLNTEFPRQVWAEEGKDQVISTLLQYLHLVPFEKRSHLEKVWPGLQQAILNSERLTIILIHDGSDPIKGTPFDSDLNELQRQYARQFKTSHDPFVTVLAASNHVFFDYSINFPSAITVPHTADPLPPPAATNTPPPLVVTAPAPAPVVAPPPPSKIIPTPDPEPQKFEIPAVVRAAAAETPPPAAPPRQMAAAMPAAAAPIKPAPAPTPPSAPAITNIPSTVVASPATTPTPAPALPQTNVAPAPASAAVIPESPPSNPPAEAVAPKLSEPAPAPSPLPATASTVQQVLLFVIALALLTIAAALVIFLIRRSRGPQQPSLITQSMDRPE